MPQQLTAAQLNQIGNEFLSIAGTIGNYRHENFSTLSDADKKQLSVLHQDLLSGSDDLAFSSAIANIDDAQDAITQIKQITDSINKDIKILTDVQTVINIAGAIITLATTIATGGASASAIAADISAAAAIIPTIKDTTKTLAT